ncbi:enoyl-CoA hydratase [Marinomonas flavescens]|uniref:enoyl-CoA hydratase n=1 Tax=Marinomonas flavescens TaxID=2529379 RepID=UPI001056053D|nr:enoyl-CoA hydratase [Marinomonas flavescens]
MSQKLLVEFIDHAAVITINNPPANTWDEESLIALKNLIIELNKNREIYSLILTGSGEKFFSAGANLNMFAQGDKDRAREISSLFGEAFEALSCFRGVSIAAINGYAMGGGLECALACDIRIAEVQISIALPEAKVGLLPCAGGTQRLLSLAGEGWVKRMILCGEQLTADQSYKIGIVEELVNQGESKGAAIIMSQKVALQSPSSVAACKSLIQESRIQLEKGLQRERSLFIQLFDTADQQEGVNAFLEKRLPKWKNA